jgi:hypothetical protein
MYKWWPPIPTASPSKEKQTQIEDQLGSTSAYKDSGERHISLLKDSPKAAVCTVRA